MAQGLQTATLGDKLRRAFGLRGLISTAVDEILVPTAHAFDIDAPPFRTDGLYFGGAGTNITNPAVLGGIVVRCDPSVRAVVNQICISNMEATPLEYRVSVVTAGTFAFGGANFARTTEQLPASGGFQTPVQIDVHEQALPITSQLYRVTVPAQSTLVLPTQISLVNVELITQANTVATDLTVSYEGRFWQGAFG